jgi:putative flippase GtrA
MNGLLRLGKFNMVGVMGMGVQLLALTCFDRWFAGRYLYASAAAIELTLIHNFIWHRKYTWSGNSHKVGWVAQFVRFHLSNGLVSMLGNLALVRLFVHELRLPLLVSSTLAVICCSLVNYSFANSWVFAKALDTEESSGHARPVAS